MTTLHIKSFGYAMLLVEDMDKSVEFYKKMLQMDPEFTSSRWSQFNLNGILIALHNAHSWSDEKDPLRAYGIGQKGLSFAFYVEDLEKYLEHLKSQEIKIEYGPRMTGIGNLVYIKDLDGYIVQIVQTLKRN